MAAAPRTVLVTRAAITSGAMAWPAKPAADSGVYMVDARPLVKAENLTVLAFLAVSPSDNLFVATNSQDGGLLVLTIAGGGGDTAQVHKLQFVLVDSGGHVEQFTISLPVPMSGACVPPSIAALTTQRGLRGVPGAASLVPGPRGPQGIPGPPGAPGAAGGPPGPQGLPGLNSNVPGPMGPTGLAGPAGPQGVPGAASNVPGPAGPQGVAGSAGVAGPAGPQGLPGFQGPAGQQGAQGAAGATGATGVAGAQGPAGLRGLPGVAGPQGLQGFPGPAGQTGPAGPAGQSVSFTGAGLTTLPSGLAPSDDVLVYRAGSGLFYLPASDLGTGTGTVYVPPAANPITFGGQAATFAGQPLAFGAGVAPTVVQFGSQATAFAGQPVTFGAASSSGGTLLFGGQPATFSGQPVSFGAAALSPSSAPTAGTPITLTAPAIIAALNYTPYDAANPAQFQTATQVSATVTAAFARIPAGPPGPAGPAGATGAPGPAGVSGPAGAAGAAGVAGATGATGPSGPAGPAGPAGVAGPAGAAGPAGPAGSPNLVVSNVYTASGSITPTDKLAIVNSTTAASMTLAAGPADGNMIVIKRYGAGAVSVAAMIDGSQQTITMSNTTFKESITLDWSQQLSSYVLI
jgi:hypothetical protein